MDIEKNEGEYKSTHHLKDMRHNWEFVVSGEVTYRDDLDDEPTLMGSDMENNTNLLINPNDESSPLLINEKGEGKKKGCCGGGDDEKKNEHHEHKLNQLQSTSIAGNDITSSIFYTIGVATLAAGKLTPISISLVFLVLYLFRSIYSEVCTALPLNGGTYNALLNTTTKGVAALAAALTILSYLATAVVSANSAAHYFVTLSTKIPQSNLNIIIYTIIILGVFAALNLLGITESANVAAAVFLFHVLSLTILVVACFIKACMIGWKPLIINWHTTTLNYNVPASIFFGYSTALLGVSGFESASNYIEEQAEGIYPKTLRNMWVICMSLFPLCTLLSQSLLPLEEIIADSNSVLAKMAVEATGKGSWLLYLISIDAVVVLMGAVLTSYVGVVGLGKRMAMDRVLPQFLLKTNRLRGTNHFIIIGFFLLSTSLVVITQGNVTVLGGVYTVAFLSVMSLFAISNILLKYKRSKLPRDVVASWFAVLTGLGAVLAGLAGNIAVNPKIMAYFSIYFIIIVFLVGVMFARVKLIKIFLFFVSHSFLGKYCVGWTTRAGLKMKDQPMIFFAKSDDLPVLNKAIQYVIDNEITNQINIVHCYENKDSIPPKLVEYAKLFDSMYPKIQVNLALVQGKFTPYLVERLSEDMKISQNFMFITCPSQNFSHKIAHFKGVRVITH
eukprot:TRINITY_DN1460_c1_g1_i1.p1 TRINITY_DN1460_c1_g1~~TRINITY_DN1460_c1_g1_i1.p1  ORF type:complete len:693 (+),score=204.88 TRINITY_DN1460_c1_g1_i1:64-2079(+)